MPSLPDAAAFLAASAAAIVTLASCAAPPRDHPAPASDAASEPRITIAAWGEMREVLRDGKDHPRTTLPDALAAVAGSTHIVGVGAAAWLRGEIAVLDSQSLLSTVEPDGSVRTRPITDDAHPATMLLIAGVRAWSTTRLDAATADIDNTLARLAAAAALDTSRPIPITIEGDATRLSAHIINGVCPVMTAPEDTPAGNTAARLHLEGNPTPLTLVGFFYPGPPGVYTHHTSTTHIHTVRIGGRAAVYHVESLELAPGAAIRLPAPDPAPTPR